MNINWLRKKLKKRFSDSKDISAIPQSEHALESLGVLGYPDIYIVDFYLSASLADQHDDHFKLNYPKICCVCGQAQKKRGNMEFRSGLFRKKIVRDLPFCQLHAPGPTTPFIIKIIRITPLVVKAVAVSASVRFLVELRQFNSAASPSMPWEAFFDLDPESSGWRQGEAEIWWNSQWWPYWEGLSHQQREQILCTNEASQAWKERLSKCPVTGNCCQPPKFGGQE